MTTVGFLIAGATEQYEIHLNPSAGAVRLSPAGWLRLGDPAGFVPGGGTEAVHLGFNPAGLAPGFYTASLRVRTSDPVNPAYHVPVSLTIPTPLQQWRLDYFGSMDGTGPAADDADWEGDGLWNIFEYAYFTHPTNADASPVTAGMESNQLTMTFPRSRPPPEDLLYPVELTEDLLSGEWRSGAAETTTVVTDNGDGTETVTVTLDGLASPTNSHYLRLGARVLP
jgi:hypothetical protein